MKHFFVLAVLIFISFGLHAQVSYQVQLNNNNTDTFSRQVIAMDDGFVTGEIVQNTVAHTYRIILSRFNACGQVLWGRSIMARSLIFHIPGLDSSGWSFVDYYDYYLPGSYLTANTYEIEKTPDNGIIAVYTDYDSIDSTHSCIVSKLDSVGNIQWSHKVFPLFKNGYMFSVSCAAIDSDGYIIFGCYDSTTLDSRLVIAREWDSGDFLAKVDNLGKLKWIQSYDIGIMGLYGVADFQKVSVFSDRSFLVWSSDGPFAGLMFKTDSMGNLQWADTDKSYAVLDDSDNVYFASRSRTLAKMDKNHHLKWAYHYAADSLQSYGGIPQGIVYTANNHIFSLYGMDPPDTTVLLETDLNGKLIRSKKPSFNTNGYNSGSDLRNMVPAPGNGVFLIGKLSNGRVTVLKLDSDMNSNCGEQNIKYNRYAYKQYVSDFKIPMRGGFGYRDTVMSSVPYKSRATIICNSSRIPNANLGFDTILCSGRTYTLNKGAQNAGAQTYWSTGDTTDSIVVTKTGKYWLQLSHGYCTSSDTVTVVFKSQIQTGLAKKISLCPYDSVLLQAKNDIKNSYTGASMYYWITPEKDTLHGDSIMAKDSGFYYLMLGGTNCPSVDTVHVLYYPLPAATAGPDTVLCHDETYTMQGAGGIKYEWIPAIYLSSATDPKAQATLPNTEHYTLVVSNAQGCHDTSQVLLSIRPPLKVKATVDNTSVCYGQSITLKATAHGGDSLHYQYHWTNDGLSGDSVTEKAYLSGWHPVVLSDNCTPVSDTDSVYVAVTPPANAAFIYSPVTKIKTHHPITFLNQSTNASSYLWTFATSGDSSKLDSPVHIYTDSGDYQVTLVAYGLNNCPNDTAYSFIKVISDSFAVSIPNAFSPDGNGINDVFDITGIGIKSYSLRIYNRWGEMVFASPPSLTPALSKGEGAGWNGTFKGSEAPEGVYIYMLNITDVDGIHHYLSGNVTLMR